MNSPVSFELSLWQKRQATVLYHYASLDYLKGLKLRVDALINGTDVLLDTAQQQGRDALVASKRWGARDTSANWSTYGFPALMDFQQTTAWDISQRAFENYGITGANQCARMLQELSMGWATEEEEEVFNERLEAVVRYAGSIDGIMRRPPTEDDFSLWLEWRDIQAQYPRLPKFKVRTDVQAEADKIPPRTGVYVPQDDPYGSLQFRWTGGNLGDMCDTYTFNEVGLDLLQTVGRDALWGDEEALFAFIRQPKYAGVFCDLAGQEIEESKYAAGASAAKAFTHNACRWYFVELVNDEYEDPDAGGSDATAVLRIPAGNSVPRPGYWFTPAKQGSRRYFKRGDTFPVIEGSSYGATFWQWSSDQSLPSL